MSVALFVPCYIDQFYPDVAVATLELLERQGLEVVFPKEQTCCGQPMANTGCAAQAEPVARRFVELFSEFDQIVCPSGSCAAMVRHHYAEYFSPDDQRFRKVRESTFELCEFLTDVVGVQSLGTRFPHRVSVHPSCHGLRELRLAPSSETRFAGGRDKLRELLALVEGVTWAEPQRSDECCGFGGTFAVNEADVSVAMGRDRIADHLAAGSEVIVAGDMSCLMHLNGLIRRAGQPLGVMHIAQVLMGRPLSGAIRPSVAVPGLAVGE
ncbi:MAG: (Fe-S)-binding protein [Planctomycetaceae bacterium]|nr:MAG: (Fe-S)-binding protein [Planctomycetaceae bacterium]